MKSNAKTTHKRSRPVVFIVHTSFVSVKDLTDLFRELCPRATVRHVVDDSLLPEVLANNGVTSAVKKRMRSHFRAAELGGADLIFNQCSSVGEAADHAAEAVRVPVLKVDSAMAERACELGPRVGVVATLETTLGPTVRLVKKAARRLGRRITIERCLVPGAFALLIKGNRPKHNRMVIAAIRKLSKTVDVIVCAQGSMVAILPELGPTKVPVLTSMRLGVEAAARRLNSF